MSKFFVGCKARVIGCFPGAEERLGMKLIGREVTLTKRVSDIHAGDGLYVHGWATELYWRLGIVGFTDSQLEPLSRPGLSAEDEKFVKDLQDALFSQLPDFNPKPRQGEIVQAGDV